MTAALLLCVSIAYVAAVGTDMNKMERYPASKIALTAVLTALSIVLLIVAEVSPVGRLGFTAAAGVMPAAATVSAGIGAGWLCYVGSAVLSLLLLPDKGIALFYLIFFGLYPLIKYFVERLRKLPLEIILKLIFFNAALTLFRFGLESVFFSAFPADGSLLWILYPLGNVLFLLYDFGLSGVISAYTVRIDRVIRKNS